VRIRALEAPFELRVSILDMGKLVIFLYMFMLDLICMLISHEIE